MKYFMKHLVALQDLSVWATICIRTFDWESVVKTKESSGNVNGSSIVNDLWTSFKGSFVSIVDKHAPLITKKVRGLTCPWMNGSIKREIRQREFLLN